MAKNGHTLKIPQKKIYFITIGEMGYSRSWTYFSSLRNSNVPVEFIQVKPGALLKQMVEIKKTIPPKSIFIVMSPSQYLAPLVWLILSKKVVLDAGWSLFEGTTLSRGIKGTFFSKAIKVFIIDFVASLFSKVILVESLQQRNFYSSIFLIRKSKIRVLYTGLDEAAFYIDPNFKTPDRRPGTKSVVLFRGKFNPEAGMETLATATRMLRNEPIDFWVYSPGLPSSIQFSANTYVSRDFLTKSQISALQKKSDLTLGQLAKHRRLARTIPHKAFESAFLGNAYLTARSSGVLELFAEEKDISCFDPGSAEDLAAKIKCLVSDKQKRTELSRSIMSTYSLRCSQEFLGQEFMRVLGEIFG